MNRYEYLEDEYEDLPQRTKILRKPTEFEREGSLTGYLRRKENIRNSAHKRLEHYA